MNMRPRILWSLVLVLSFSAAALSGLRAADEGYVCPPCSCGQDAVVSTNPGLCSACRMKLLKKSEIQRVAILLYDGVQIIDYAAPWEVFGQAGFEVFTVSATGAPVTSTMGMSLNAGYSFANSPEPTILLLPGGGERQAWSDPATIAWVSKNAAASNHVLSVCSGALILAKAGLLDGQKATTFYFLLDQLGEAGKGIQVVTDQRWVDNGKIITSAGLSSGLDAAIHLVSKIRGLGAAQRVALTMEYDWKPDGGYARGALAEKHIPHLSGTEWETAELLSTSGDRDRWESRYRIVAESTPGALLGRVGTVLDSVREWKADGGSLSSGKAMAGWKFVDDSGAAWSGMARVEPAPGTAGIWAVTLEVSRAVPPTQGK